MVRGSQPQAARGGESRPSRQRCPTAGSCRICGGETSPVCVVHGSYSKRDYHLSRCGDCRYVFVVDPWLDFAAIYDDRYYAGEGADRWVDYRFELEQGDRAIRYYEWHGISRLVAAILGGPDPRRRWLDYGCGNGGLVRHLRNVGAAEAFGYDEGAITEEARARGIPTLNADGLAAASGTFDVVTAIEVIEHTRDPVAELRRMRGLLRRGGLLYVTTGNAQPYADKLARWRYLLPELHISYFEPGTLARAMIESGFEPERRALGRGFDEIMKFKVLQNLYVRRRSRLTDLLPAPAIRAIADRVVKLSDHPVGWAV